MQLAKRSSFLTNSTTSKNVSVRNRLYFFAESRAVERVPMMAKWFSFVVGIRDRPSDAFCPKRSNRTKLFYFPIKVNWENDAAPNSRLAIGKLQNEFGQIIKIKIFEWWFSYGNILCNLSCYSNFYLLFLMTRPMM